VLIRISDLQVFRGSMTRSNLIFVTDWARVHQAELALNRVFARAKMDLWKIPYP
jgi:hypothetical protein